MLWKVFFDKRTGKELCRYSIEGEFAEEEEKIKSELAEERKTTSDNILTRIEDR